MSKLFRVHKAIYLIQEALNNLKEYDILFSDFVNYVDVKTQINDLDHILVELQVKEAEAEAELKRLKEE